MIHTGCTLSYPADWAVTNGYVKRVRVFALVETDYGTGSYPLPVWSYTEHGKRIALVCWEPRD